MAVANLAMDKWLNLNETVIITILFHSKKKKKKGNT